MPPRTRAKRARSPEVSEAPLQSSQASSQSSQAPSASALHALSTSHGLIIVALYNYKGGVGKTTNLIQIASCLALDGVKTLMVDADPQCNLTSFFSRDEEGDDDENMTDGGQVLQQPPSPIQPPNPVQSGSVTAAIRCEQLAPAAKAHDLITFRNARLNPSLYSLLNPVFSGDSSGMVAPQLTPVDAAGNMFLLHGSPDIVQYESSLSLARANPMQSVTQYGAFRRLVTMTAEKVGAKVVLVDFGPSSGILNQVFVMSCDYILPPCFADFYSVCSAEGLLRSLLPFWLDWQAAHLAEQPRLLAANPSQKPFEFKKTGPQILPFLITAYKMHHMTSTIAKASSAWILDLKALVKAGDMDPRVQNLYHPLDGQMVIPLLEHAGQLIQYSHQAKRAFVEFTDETLSGVRDDKNNLRMLMKRVEHAKDRYFGLTRAIINLPPV